MDPSARAHDEMFTADGHVRPHYAVYADWLTRQPDDALRQKRAEADRLFVKHTAAEALDLGVGVCQDQAHVLVACCRSVGVPGRYVSGYFQGGHVGEVASHAWADVWLGAELGWTSLDVTHAEAAGARHCRLAVGRDYLDAAPVRGVRRGGGHESMAVTVSVTSGQVQQ